MENEVEKIKKELDDLCNDVATNAVVVDINRYQIEHADKIFKEYGRFVSQFELYYDLIVSIFHAVNYIDKKSWPGHRTVQFLLFVHNLKSLYSSFDRLIHGFYEDSIILSRPAYEAFIKSVYITCDPSDPYAVVSGLKGKMKNKFNLTNFLKDELKIEWHDYKLFSALAHANQYSVLAEAKDIFEQGQKEAITLKFWFDKKLFELGVNDINYLLLVNLKAIVVLFSTSVNDVLTQVAIDKAKKLIDLRERDFASHPKEYWPRVIKDTKDIFKMIESVNMGEKWADSWIKIRNS